MNARRVALPLIAVTLIATTACTGQDRPQDSPPKEVRLLADADNNREVEIIVSENIDPTIWISSENNQDPRADGKPDPSLCRVVSGGGEIVEPDRRALGTEFLKPTNLYPVAKIKDFKPPTVVTCSGSDFNHFYVGMMV